MFATQSDAVKGYFLLFFALLLFGCSKDDQVEVEDPSQILVGDIRYQLLEGDGQSGAYTEQLGEIKLLARDLSGNTVRRPLDFRLSDESGSIVSFSYSGDTLAFIWKLGCYSQRQTITVVDTDVCGVKRDKCIEADVLEIYANASLDSLNGWYTPCAPFDLSDYYSISIANDMMFVQQNDVLYTTTDPNGLVWRSCSTAGIDDFDYEDEVNLSGSFYFYASREIAFLNQMRTGLDNTSNPTRGFNSTYHTELVSDENGSHFLGHRSQEIIYHSPDGLIWRPLVDMDSVYNTDGLFYDNDPQGIATFGDSFYVLSRNRFVAILDMLSRAVVTYELDRNWQSYQELGDFEVYVVDTHKLLISYGGRVDLIDLDEKTISTLDSGTSYEFFKSNNRLHAVRGEDQLVVWNETGFDEISTSYYTNENPDASIIGIYFGQPVVGDRNRNISIFK